MGHGESAALPDGGVTFAQFGIQVFQLVPDVPRGLVSSTRVFLETPSDDPGQIPRDIGPKLRECARGVPEDGRSQLRTAGPGEGPPPRRHLVQDHPEREHVAAVVDHVSLDLLRRHVRGGPEKRTLAGDGLLHLDLPVLVLPGGPKLREAEIEHFDRSVPAYHHVRRLQVPVNDATLVSRAHRVGQRGRDRQQAIDLQTFRRDQGGERAPADQLHREEVNPPLLFDAVDRDDSRVMERSDGPRLAAEPLEAIRLAGELGREDLHGDLPSELHVEGPEHDSHSAPADLLEEAIVGEDRSAFRVHTPRTRIL
jgi:hypothetical protein